MTASSLWDNPIDVAIHLGLKTGQEDESVYDGLLQQQQQQQQQLYWFSHD